MRLARCTPRTPAAHCPPQGQSCPCLVPSVEFIHYGLLLRFLLLCSRGSSWNDGGDSIQTCDIVMGTCASKDSGPGRKASSSEATDAAVKKYVVSDSDGKRVCVGGWR